MLYTEYLTPAERLEAVRAGAASALAEAGITPSELDAAIKSAADSGSIPVPVPSLTGMANAAIITGVPLGLMYYIISKSLNKSNRKTRQMQRELDYYNDVMSEFKNNYRVSGEDEEEQ